jgi:hypothetical protein
MTDPVVQRISALFPELKLEHHARLAPASQQSPTQDATEPDSNAASTTDFDLTTGLWIVGHKEGSGYHDVDGHKYHFKTRIHNGKNIQQGDLVFCYRMTDSTEADKGCLFGVGRVSRRKVTPDGKEAEIYFDPYYALHPPIPLKKLGDPRSGARNSMEKVSAEWAAEVLRHAGLAVGAVGLTTSISQLTVEAVLTELERLKLFLDTRLVAQAVAALRAGKHVMLCGQPGTGKTEFGNALAAAAERLGICAGLIPATATADWTSSDTVGAYRLKPPSDLVFQPGQLLQSIDEERWIVIDELNRADIDKAIGQFFTVLSGQPVVLPYLEEAEDGRLLPTSIVPPGKVAPPGSRPHRIHQNWRVIATLNNRDRDLLFDMSEALIRRFAVIEVGPPDDQHWRLLLADRADTGSADLNAALLLITQFPGCPLGPAIVIDCAAFLKARMVVASEMEETLQVRELFSQAVDMYVRPHLVGEKAKIDAYLAKVYTQAFGKDPSPETPPEAELLDGETDAVQFDDETDD